MRNLKKVLSLVLCMAMMLSVMVVGAGAAFKDQDKIVNDEAVDMCEALNIINGYTDGSFKPEGTITRAEACKMICVALNGGKEPVLGTAATAAFTDTKGHWAEGYIEYCVSEGIVAGIGGGKFNPNGNVTGSQFAKMLLIALGYRADHENFLGNAWEVNVNVKASAKGLYEDLEKMDASAALTRDNAAQMVWNALQAKEVKYEYTLVSENGQLVSKVTVEDKDDTMLDYKYDGEVIEGTLASFTYDSNKEQWTYVVNNTSMKSSTDFTALLGQDVKAVYDNTGKAPFDAYGIFANDSEVVLTGIIADLPDIDTKDKNFKIDGVKYNLTDEAQNINVKVFNGSSTLDLMDVAAKNVTTYDAQAFTAIDLDGDGDIDYLMVVPYAVAKVGYVNSDKFKVNVKADPFGIMGKDENGKAITAATYEFDDVNSYDGLAKDDYVTIVAAANTADNTDTFAKVDLIAGKITAKDGADVSVDGTWYTVDASYTGNSSVGTTMKDAPVVNGFIFDADTTNSKDIDEYAVIVSIVASANNGLNGDQAKLLFADGTKKVVDLDKTYDSNTYKAGTLVTFDVNSDDEYELNTAPTTKAGSGFDITNASADIIKASNSSSKVGYIGKNNQVSDDSVIFVQYNGGKDFKVITGAQLKTMGVADFGTNKAYVLATENDKTGVNTVDMAYVTATTTDINANDSYYAYVTKVVEAQNADDKDIYTVTLWTADGEKVLNTVKNYNNSNGYLAKGNVVEYKLNADGEINDVLWGADASNSAWTTLTDGRGYSTSAITAWNGDIFTFNNVDTYELDDDIVYLFIDDSETEGLSGYTSADIAIADKDENDKLIKNAFVLLDTTSNDRNVLLVVYDVDNEF